MKKKWLIAPLLLGFGSLSEAASSFGSLGDSFTSFGSSISGTFQMIGASFTGAVESGQYYAFRVFNGSNIPVTVSISKVIDIMGMRYGNGSGGSTSIQPGQDTGSTGPNCFVGQYAPNLYMSIDINGSGLSYSEDHFTLGKKNDPNVYFYHVYNDSTAGAPVVEIVGAGYTTSGDYSGRIENKTSSIVPIMYTLYTYLASSSSSTSSGVATHASSSLSNQQRIFTIPDVEPNTFCYITTTIDSDYSLRPPIGNSFLQCGSSKVIIPQLGVASLTSTDTSKPITTTPVTYNYAYTSGGFFETGMAPGHFDQPSAANQLRDISPMNCQFFNQAASQTAPIGALLAYDIPWQSLWFVYSGYGWSEQQQAVVQYPCGMIPRSACIGSFFIRPSVASVTANGPARLYLVRLNVPENATGAQYQNAQQFLKNLVSTTSSSSQMVISCLGTDAQGSTIITTDTTSTIPWTNFQNWNPFSLTLGYLPNSPIPAYPPLSATALTTQTINPLTIPLFQRFTLLSTKLPSSVGLIQNTVTGISGYVLLRDSFLPYGSGAGPFQYVSPSPYLDISQMISTIFNFAMLAGFKNLTSDVMNQLMNATLMQTVMGWLSAYSTQPTTVRASMATFLLMIAQGRIAAGSGTRAVALLDANAFGGSSFILYSETGAESKLSPQAIAVLKMLLFGPSSMTQFPTYHKVASGGLSPQIGWPAVTAIV